MKKIQIGFLALVATLFSSCAGMPPVQVPGGQLVFGQGGDGQQLGGGYQNPQQQQFAVTRSERCYVRLGADAPKPVVQMVETATAAAVQSLFAKSCFAHDGQRGEWPDINQVNGIAQELFHAKGHSLSPGAEGASRCFKVMEYRPGLPPG